MDVKYDFFWHGDANTDNTNRFLNLLLNNEFRSDVTFLIGRDRKRVPGHSLILCLCSWDFFNIFELLKLDNNEIILEDVEYDTFMVFLEYCYTLTVDLSNDYFLEKTLGILKLAQRFHLQSLEEICKKNITEKLCATNAMIVFKNKDVFPVDYSLPKILYYFSSLIQMQSSLDIFLDLPLEGIRYFAKLSPIQCDEMEMFDVLMKWAKRNCEKNGIPTTPRYLRKILSDVFYEIRFPTMKLSWFSQILAQYPNMFIAQEISWICCKINKSPAICAYSCQFKCEPRQSIDYIYKIFSFGVCVNFFSGVPDMDNGTTRQMTSNFFARTTTTLIGFAFVAKKDEKVKVTSCKLRTVQNEWKNIAISPSGRTKFSWDYDLIAIQFNETQELLGSSRPFYDYAVQLFCEFDKAVPNLSSKTSPTQMQHNNIYMLLNEPNAIPYLIVMMK